jgi:hypothetical protein
MRNDSIGRDKSPGENAMHAGFWEWLDRGVLRDRDFALRDGPPLLMPLSPCVLSFQLFRSRAAAVPGRPGAR